MEVVLKFFQGFINMGASTLLPFVIAILGIFFGMKIGRAIKAGLLVGIGFQGLVLAVNLLITSVTPAMQYYKDLGSGYDTLEIGFAALGAASWTTPFAVLVIPAIIIANLILVRLKVTKVLNVDIWNFMHFLVPGALAYALTKNAVIGFIVAFACGMAVLFFGQWIAKPWQEFFGLEGTTCTCLCFVAWAYPICYLLNKIIDKIPGLNKVDVDMTPMVVLSSKGNLVRSLIGMTLMMYLTLFFANMFIPEATQMMSVTNVHFAGTVTASHFGWNPGNLIVSFIHRIMMMIG